MDPGVAPAGIRREQPARTAFLAGAWGEIVCGVAGRRLARGRPGPIDVRPTASRRARGPGADRSAQRQSPRADVRGRPAAGAGGSHPGAVRTGRDAAGRRRPGEGAVAPARAELSAAAGHRRSGEFLGEHLSASPQGPPRPVSEARLAGGPARRRADATDEAVTPLSLSSSFPNRVWERGDQVMAAGWKQLIPDAGWCHGAGRYPLDAYSEFMPPPRLGVKPYGDDPPNPQLFHDDDPFGWWVHEFEEARELRPGLQQVADQIVLKFVGLLSGKQEHGIASRDVS